MLINARPRIVLNGFEAFVPTQRVESLHQRLVEMTNNDANAWGFFRPVASSTSNTWDQHLDEFSNGENCSLPGLYAGYYQDSSSLAQAQAVSLPKASSYTSLHQHQSEFEKRYSTTHTMYQEPMTEINCFERPSPMLGSGYSQWNLGQRHGSFAEFSNARSGMRDYPYQNSTGSDPQPFASTLSLAPQSSYQEDATVANDFVRDSTSTSNTFNSYSSSTTPIDPLSLITLGIPNSHDGLMKSAWWPENSGDNKGRYGDIYEMTLIRDGQLKIQNQQQQYCGVWNAESGPTNRWTSSSAAPITVSPKALTLNLSSSQLSTSGSSQGATLSLSDSRSGLTYGEDSSDFSGPENLLVVEPQVPTRQPRSILPDSIPNPRRIVPVLASNDFSSSKALKKRSLKSKSRSHSRTKGNSPHPGTGLTSQSCTQKIEPVPQKLAMPKKIEPKPTSSCIQQSLDASSQSSAAAQAMHHRDAKDDFLIRSKLAGMSYKDIRRQGNFTEAESTLRGRFRTLTKLKAARVRKPEWDDNDIRLLRKAVRKLTNGSDPSKTRVPWKQVAEYIANNGGSYHFGNATCRKRWDELQIRSGL